MATEFTYDVFLSHGSKDKPVVHELAARLKKDGIRVWLDEKQIKPGDSIPAKIEEGLEHFNFGFRTSDFGFAQPGMSANAFGSDWAQLRLTHSQLSTLNHQPACAPLNQERRFISLRFDDAPTAGSPTAPCFVGSLLARGSLSS